MGALLRAAGLPGFPPENHPEEVAAFALVQATAEAFLAAGGVVTLAEFAELEPLERALLAEAARKVQAERAAAFGLAAQGPLAAAQVLAPVDGGAARTRVLLERAAAQAVGP